MKTLEEAIALRDELEQEGTYALVYADHTKHGFVAIALNTRPGERNGHPVSTVVQEIHYPSRDRTDPIIVC